MKTQLLTHRQLWRTDGWAVHLQIAHPPFQMFLAGSLTRWMCLINPKWIQRKSKVSPDGSWGSHTLSLLLLAGQKIECSFIFFFFSAGISESSLHPRTENKKRCFHMSSTRRTSNSRCGEEEAAPPPLYLQTRQAGWWVWVISPKCCPPASLMHGGLVAAANQCQLPFVFMACFARAILPLMRRSALLYFTLRPQSII